MNERNRIQIVRNQVALRDGPCRLGGNLTAAMGQCGGASEWAHLEEHRRFKTRKMPPAVRHTTGGTCMLCTLHHQQYDAHRLEIEFLTERQADGPMAFTLDGRRFEESSDETKSGGTDDSTGPREHGVGVRGTDEAQPDPERPHLYIGRSPWDID